MEMASQGVGGWKPLHSLRVNHSRCSSSTVAASRFSLNLALSPPEKEPISQSKNLVPGKKNLPCSKPNRLGHAGRELARLNLLFSPCSKRKHGAHSPNLQGREMMTEMAVSVPTLLAPFSKRFLKLPTHESCAQTIEHATQGVGYIGEKGPHQKLPFLRRTGCRKIREIRKAEK